MDFFKTDIQANEVDRSVAMEIDSDVLELADLQYAFVGGGIADTIPH